MPERAMQIKPTADQDHLHFSHTPPNSHENYPMPGGVMSILFERPEDGLIQETLEAPDFFGDLNLDQVIETVTAGKQEYNLKSFFYTPLHQVDAVRYRHEIFRDLENPFLFESIKSFVQKMQKMRSHLALIEKLYYKVHKEGWFLETVEGYCEAVNGLANDFSDIDLESRGFSAFREYLVNYADSPGFKSLWAETKKLQAELSTVKYCLLIKGATIRVSRYESEIDYSPEIEETFEKFKQGAVKDYRIKYSDWPENMNHVEANILDLIAKLYPNLFLNLDYYCQKNVNFLDGTLSLFDREIQFYVAYLEYISNFKRVGLKFCYPRISSQSKEVYNVEGFDLALANKLLKENSPIACNDFYLKDKERIFVVSGPNQGGKTTFARTFGQLHYLAGIGCPVPGREAQLLLFDGLFTHFEREENIKNLRGKLQDDLVRIHAILSRATPNSLIILNEIFTSTTIQDAVFLSKKVMEEITKSDPLCVWVTFIDELASFSEQTVSMVSTIVPENPALRTYKIVRRPADGLSYAIAIAEKYRLTYESLRERIKS